MTIVVCRCGQSFMGDESADALCTVCETERDPFACKACGTRLLEVVPKGLCGICDPEWVLA